MFQVSESIWWYVAALAFLGIALFRRNKSMIYFLLTLLAAILTVDWFCYSTLKPYVLRDRPCYALKEAWTPPPFYCKDQFGFPSNHSANAMTVVVMAGLWWKRRVGFLLLPLALLIGLSRIYLGVHYPMDILMGYVVGFCFAVLWFAGVTKLWTRP